MKKKLLIIDDDILYQRIIQNIFNSEYQLFFAMKYKEAIEILKNGVNPDLVIADMNIPGVCGIDLIMRIKNEIDRNIPIIVISGMDDEKLKTNLFELGVAEVIVKPIERKELKEKIKSLF